MSNPLQGYFFAIAFLLLAILICYFIANRKAPK